MSIIQVQSCNYNCNYKKCNLIFNLTTIYFNFNPLPFLDKLFWHYADDRHMLNFYFKRRRICLSFCYDIVWKKMWRDYYSICYVKRDFILNIHRGFLQNVERLILGRRDTLHPR